MVRLWLVVCLATKNDDVIFNTRSFGLLVSGTEEFALGSGYKQLEEDFPQEQGWEHKAKVKLVPKVTILEILENVDE